ncbi:MAG TPA: alpha/beta fold hydrolase [Bacteroidales bacterium]|nr:alpha/beta fold hydrolase [Bacteroidales bacterium]
MQLNYKKYGDGPPLVILHGLYGSSDNWHSIAKALSDKYTVYIPDQRNHGKSPHSDKHDFEVMKNDLKDFADDLRLEKFYLMGHSMGGKTAMLFAADFPERIEALIIVDISPKSYHDEIEFSSETVDHASIIDAMKELDINEADTRKEVDKELSQKIKSTRVRQFLLKNLDRNKNGDFHWILNLESLGKNLPLIMEGLPAARFNHGTGISAFPVLFIKGENSGYILDEDYTKIRQFFPRAHIVTIPGAGHWLHAEEPELFLKNVEYFLRDN